MEIPTRFLIISDTHAETGFSIPDTPVDVAIHCGDLTEESKIQEFRTALDLLRSINAPLKLVIAGNHDFTLDTPTFQKKASDAVSRRIDPELIKKEFGDLGEARQLFLDAKSDNIVFLEEGTHHFRLQNGAKLTVYASPFTPSKEAQMGFQFKSGEEHHFAMDNVDIAITHGPPRGILDRTDSKERGGCEHLFAAVAAARPRLHCFGHIHEGWGAKLVAWRGDSASEHPSHFSDIDNGASVLVESLASLKPRKCDGPEEGLDKMIRALTVRETNHTSGAEHALIPGRNTLFVNAAIESLEPDTLQLPWIVNIDLPRAPPIH